MKTITRISRLLTVLFNAEADQLARETGFVQRQVKVTGSNFAQTLVWGFLNDPQMSYRQMSQAGVLSGLHITAQGWEQRFSAASATFLQRLLAHTVQHLIVSAQLREGELLQRFGHIHIQDGSVISLPDVCAPLWPGVRPPDRKGCAALKLHVDLEYKSGRLCGPVLAPGREHDQRSPFFGQALQAGDLRLVDLGFFQLDQLERDSQAGAFWIIRYKHNVQLYQHGQALALWPFLRKHGDRPLDLPVQVGQQHRLPCRLIALPADPSSAAQRTRKLREYARKKQVSLSAQRLALARWTLILTNAPQSLLSVAEVYALLRLRWQIELLFRLWKTCTLVDESTSKNPWRLLTELYAKLIAVVIQHWLLLASVWHPAEGSGMQAARTIQKFAVLLHLSLQDPSALTTSLSTLVKVLQFSPPLLKRRKQPSTAQILRHPPLALC